MIKKKDEYIRHSKTHIAITTHAMKIVHFIWKISTRVITRVIKYAFQFDLHRTVHR